MLTDEEIARAAMEDLAVERVLAQTHLARPVAITPESIEAGDASLADTYREASARFQRRLESKELLTADEFCHAVGVDVDWLNGALHHGRVFALMAPNGESYYPAFYAEPGLDRADIERVVNVLSEIGPVSQFTFFYQAWTPLGTTPVDALRAGRVGEVMRTAIGFAEDAPRKVNSRHI
ncbi:hypothetical protein NHH73_02900 [Oxalobacteraceae bacterium OTU3CINTB1]|nr:hypothetical protein NHH73_02900 [Oxalobacteraceae bacterium OTU3CINTB1]